MGRDNSPEALGGAHLKSFGANLGRENKTVREPPFGAHADGWNAPPRGFRVRRRRGKGKKVRPTPFGVLRN